MDVLVRQIAIQLSTLKGANGIATLHRGICQKKNPFYILKIVLLKDSNIC